MTVIRTGTIHYEQGTYKQIVNYTLREKRFWIVLPPWTHDFLGYEKVYGETLDQVDSAFIVTMREFDELARYKKRVIVYEFKARVFIMDKEGKRCIFRKEEISFAEGTGLTFNYGVYDERLAPGEKTKKYYRPDGRFAFSEYMTPYSQMEWTNAREDFCKLLKKNLENLIMNAWDFFHQDPEQMVLLIDSGMNLLPGPIERGLSDESTQSKEED